MASYFDSKPPKPPPKHNSTLQVVETNEGFPQAGLLSPQVSRMIDELEDHSSSSDSDSSGETVKQKTTKPGKTPAIVEPSHHTTTASSVSSDPSGKGPANPSLPRLKRHPRLERFVSLRSSLFSSHVADNLSKCEAEHKSDMATSQHEPRKSSKLASGGEVPPADVERPQRATLVHRMSNTLRKITSRDAPTVEKIKESEKATGGANFRRDSAIGPGEERNKSEPRRDTGGSDEKRRGSLSESDVEDLVRWVSRRSAPDESASNSSGQPDRSPLSKQLQEPSDVHAKRHKTPSEAENKENHEYSDVSTESDLEGGESSLEDEDVNELVQWVSRSKDPTGGPGGPIRDGRSLGQGLLAQRYVNDLTQESNTPDMERSIMHEDEASPMPDVEAFRSKSDEEDEFTTTQEERPGSDKESGLAQTVKMEGLPENDQSLRHAAILKWKLEKERQERAGTVDRAHRGSLTVKDIDELVKHVREELKWKGEAEDK